MLWDSCLHTHAGRDRVCVLYISIQLYNNKTIYLITMNFLVVLCVYNTIQQGQQGMDTEEKMRRLLALGIGRDRARELVSTEQESEDSTSALDLPEIEQQGMRCLVYSHHLDECIWIVGTEDQVESVKPEVAYTVAECRQLVEQPPSPGMLRKIHLAKEIMDGELLGSGSLSKIGVQDISSLLVRHGEEPLE